MTVYPKKVQRAFWSDSSVLTRQMALVQMTVNRHLSSKQQLKLIHIVKQQNTRLLILRHSGPPPCADPDPDSQSIWNNSVDVTSEIKTRAYVTPRRHLIWPLPDHHSKKPETLSSPRKVKNNYSNITDVVLRSLGMNDSFELNNKVRNCMEILRDVNKKSKDPKSLGTTLSRTINASWYTKICFTVYKQCYGFL